MKPIRTWILVADGARARFLENLGPGKGLQPALEEELQQDLPPNRDIVTDKPGRGAGPNAGRHGYTPRVDWHEFEKERFAQQVARVLDKARAENRFDRLVLVAPPKALGHLRDELNERTRDTVTGELHKDLTHTEDAELARHLGKVMAV